MARALILGLAMLGAVGRADAAPLLFEVQFPFTFSDDQTSTTFAQFEIGLQYNGTTLSQVSVRSADLDLSGFGTTDFFDSSAPIGVAPQIPAGSPFVGAFKMPTIVSTGLVDDGAGSVFATFGPGGFAVEALGGTPCTTPDPSCWLGAQFLSATLQIQDGLPTNFFGNAEFAGPIFGDTGLVNPGTFAYALTFQQVTDTGVNFTALGALSAAEPDTAAPVPEPATMTLLGVGLAGSAARAWRQRRKAA